jgi:arabinoxylan arabinofuranohydrolase
MKFFSFIILALFVFGIVQSQNPIVKHIFTADPSAHVFDGKMYIYPSHDRDDAKGFDMTDYHVFSSSDLKNWKDHDVVLDVKNVPWAKEFMWAPDCVHKNGTYYFYFPARDKDGVFRIGVATAQSPSGPFVAESQPIKGSYSVDPAVFTDDDGQTYMYFGGAGMGGQKNPSVAKLDETMKEFSSAPTQLTGIDYWFEACWMNKIGKTYYLSYSTGGNHPTVKGASGIAYATSDNPMGPFVYKGLLNKKVSGWTNHHSIVEWKGQTYFFYHTSDLSAGKTNKRCIAAEYVHITSDGIIQEVIQTKIGIGGYDGLVKIEAKNYSESKSSTKVVTDNTIKVAFRNNSEIVFNNVDFRDKKVKKIQCNIASENAKGKFEIYEKGENGKLLAKIPVKSKGGILNFQTISSKLSERTGTLDFTIKYKGNDRDLVVLQWLNFTE